MIAHEFVSSSLETLDQLQTELIVLPFFSDERPMRGVAGLVDWRLCASLSRKRMAGYVDERFARKSLFAHPPKLETEGLLLVGLGASPDFDTRLARRACLVIAHALRDARVSTVALALPGRSVDLLPAVEAMQIWLEVEPEAPNLDEVCIIEAPKEHRALASLVDSLRRQAESPLD